MRPMLTTVAERAADLPADGAAWAYEVKWDGVRVLAEISGDPARVRLTSRAGNDVTAGYPEAASLAELAGSGGDLVLDGEIVVLRSGVPSFSALAERMHVRDQRRVQALAARAPATFVVFDVLRRDGADLTGLPWTQRRAVLEGLAAAAPGRGPRPWQVSPVYADRDALVAATLEQGLEGVVAKRRGSRYAPGGRTGDWVKLAHKHLQACLVGGWRWETGGRDRIGALLLGIWRPGAQDAGGADDAGGPPMVLAFAGRVGSGLSTAVERDLRDRLTPLRTPSSPFGTPVPAVDADGAVWTRPEVVVEVRYLGRGGSGRLRQPVFRGVRTDLDPADVRDEP
jgi:bifunctional non-homologous end joining protein LigD